MYRVLLVEDNAAQRFLAAHLTAWASCGFCVAAMAADGKDAMELLGRESFDLVLTDIRMPVMDGLALLRAVHALGAKAPAVVLASSYSDFSYAREGLQHGALDYLVKPYTEQSVRETLQRILPRSEFCPAWKKWPNPARTGWRRIRRCSTAHSRMGSRCGPATGRRTIWTPRRRCKMPRHGSA